MKLIELIEFIPEYAAAVALARFRGGEPADHIDEARSVVDAVTLWLCVAAAAGLYLCAGPTGQ